MKTYSVYSILFLFCSFWLQGQEARINIYADHVFADQFSSYFGSGNFFDGRVEEGFRWGAGLEYQLPGNSSFELQYLREETKAPTRYSTFAGGVERTDFELTLNYILLNSTRYFPLNQRVEAFFGGGLGLGLIYVDNPDTLSSDQSTKFAWQVRGGANLWLNPYIAIKLQASLVSVVQAVGGGLYFGTGGAGLSFDSYSTIYQFGLGGGLVFRI
ncbi:hypothetical protein [Robertkochia aurantiaca]|uniref:hypothetical protein n=1 Tax=Robertkochia aurantiaca TaxID=2873700 RepID=UPI001CCBFCD5|nr:hypothetical protein [Robertkochia sp. 3YJGBD-33]